MNRTDIDDIARDMWATRPARRRTDRKIAGVSAAVARRYSIDPILVRIAFVVATIFGGIGILLYLLGWLLLPEEGDTASGAEALVGHGRSSMSRPLTIVLAIALIPASVGFFAEGLTAVLALAIVGGGFFLMHRHRAGLAPAMAATGTAFAPGVPGMPGGLGMPGVPGMPGGPGMPGMPVGAPYAHGGHVPGTQYVPGAPGGGYVGAPGVAGESGPHGGTDPVTGQPTSPPAWDPLGVAPFAWDLPEPTPVEPPQPPRERRHRSPVTAVTMAVALMAAGAATIVAMSTEAVGPREVAAFTLAVVGIGLVVGSFVRGGRGLIAVAIPLGLVTYGLAVVPPDHFGAYGVGDRTWVVPTAAALQPTYRLSAGNMSLDLRDLRLADTQEVTTTITLGAGELNVLLPRDADVELRCEAGVGEVDCLGDTTNGVDQSADRTDGGDDGPGKGGTIVLNVSLGAGQAVISRG
jgi:phage shock protein PspC (stress-responsive transcriptional regulator)